jgi:ABC-type sugar transport system ATPase subunit
VDLVEQMGGESYVYVILANGARLTVRRPGQTALRTGDNVHITIEGDAHLFAASDGHVIGGRR